MPYGRGAILALLGLLLILTGEEILRENTKREGENFYLKNSCGHIKHAFLVLFQKLSSAYFYKQNLLCTEKIGNILIDLYISDTD